MRSSMDDIDPGILAVVRDHINSGNQITDEALIPRLDEITAAYRKLRADTTNAPENHNASEWAIKVIACNDAVEKSLHPKVQMSIGEHRVEMDAEKLSELRYSVAHLLHRMHHYI